MTAVGGLERLEDVLVAHEGLDVLLAGAAIPGAARTPLAPLGRFVRDDGVVTPLWHQAWRGRGARVVSAGAAVPELPSATELARFLRALAVERPPDVAHIFITLEARSRVIPAISVPGHTCFVRPTSYRYVLPLGDDYAAFVQGLGKHTRRNIRLYHRRAEADGLSFAFAPQAPRSDRVSVAERADVGRMTLPKPKSAQRLGELDAFLRVRQRPFHSTIRARDGRLLSVATGFRAGASAYLVYQANHKEHPDANLGLTHRTHLIRALIAEGARMLVFPNGVNDILRNACRRDYALEFLILRDGLFARWRTSRWQRREPNHPAARFLASARAGGGAATLVDDP